MACNTCFGCGGLFFSDVADVYCTPECKKKAHDRLAPRRPHPKPATLPLYQAFQALADESAKYDAFHQRMRRV